MPISTSLRGGDNDSENIVSLKHVDEELAWIWKYKSSGWHIGYLKAPNIPAKKLRVAGQKSFNIGGGISKGWDNTGRVSIYWKDGKWEQHLGMGPPGGVSQGDYVELKLRGILFEDRDPWEVELNTRLHNMIVAANENLPRLLDGVCSFYYPGKNAEVDDIYNAPFLGNFYPCSISLKVGNMTRPLHFTNSEAAFQALKAPTFDEMKAFTSPSGSEALQRMSIQHQTYQGLNSNWTAMMEVLMAKFEQNNELKELLIQTGEAYLLEHKMTKGKDEKIWSDNCDGSGRNWLGLQLMLVREIYRSKKPWNQWLERFVPQATPAAIIADRKSRASYNTGNVSPIAT